MAKRYAKYQFVTEGSFKPAQTLGNHHATVVRQGELLVVVGSKSGRVTLKPGDTLGYDCGTVWLVPRVESYRDPIRRVLAQAHLSQKLLEYSAEPVEYTVSYQDTSSWPENSSADPSTGEEAQVFGSHENVQSENGDGWHRQLVTGGEAVVVRHAVGRETTLNRPRRVTRVVVRPTADKAAVTEFLFEELTLEGRERRRQREVEYDRIWREEEEPRAKEMCQKIWKAFTRFEIGRPRIFRAEEYVVAWGHGQIFFMHNRQVISLKEVYRSGMLQRIADIAIIEKN